MNGRPVRALLGVLFYGWLYGAPFLLIVGPDPQPSVCDLLIGDASGQRVPCFFHGLLPCGVVHYWESAPDPAELFTGFGMLACADQRSYLFFGDLAVDSEQRGGSAGPPAGRLPVGGRVGVVGDDIGWSGGP